MPLYLLDTDAMIDFFNGVTSTVRLIRRLHTQGDLPCVCDVIVAEAVSGVRENDREQAEEWLRAYPFLESTFAIGMQAGAWRHGYARRGITISAADAIIAATALEYDATLLTRNVRHFPMPEIKIESLPPDER